MRRARGQDEERAGANEDNYKEPENQTLPGRREHTNFRGDENAEISCPIDLLAILNRIRIERYFATFCRIFESAQY